MNYGRIDRGLVIPVVILLLLGTIMVFSASSMMANHNFGSLFYFFYKQLIWGVLAVGLMILFSFIDYKKFRSVRFRIFSVTTTLVLLAGLFVFGKTTNQATRWYDFGIVNFQPSEMARIVLIIYFAGILSSRANKLHDFKNTLFMPMIVLVSTLVLIMAEPDLSTTLMIGTVVGVMMFVSRVKLMHIIAMILPIIPAIVIVMKLKPYQWSRIVSWYNTFNHPLDAPYQILQSLIGLGRGGFTGQGPGDSKQKYMFLPDSHTDFIFSIIGEEIGFIGTTVILAFFLFFLFRGFRLAGKVTDGFGKFLVIGITCNIVLYAFINAAVVTHLLPATGLPMPFISYGGSNLIFLGISTGILLNISRHSYSEGATGNWTNFGDRRNEICSTLLPTD